MQKSSHKLTPKASVSLSAMLETYRAAPHAATKATRKSRKDKSADKSNELVSVLIEAGDPDKLCYDFKATQKREQMEKLTDGYLSANICAASLDQLLNHQLVERIQSKKRSRPQLMAAARDIRLVKPSNGERQVIEDGSGVLIGIVDTGFDLSHPAFRQRGQLRVAGLMDQENGDKQYTTAQLEHHWADGTGPGKDLNGHGTHVAAIAAGTAHRGFEGVAPNARFLLVRTDFINTDKAVKWVFQQADRLGMPCVVNLSLAHHFGSHDGTDVEERFQRAITGPGKLIVVSAGNDRDAKIHIGGRFFTGETQEVGFDIFRQDEENPNATLTLWHDPADNFAVKLVTPDGEAMRVPAGERQDVFRDEKLRVKLSRRRNRWSKAIQLQLEIEYRTTQLDDRELNNWRLRLTCQRATLGRLDGWFHNHSFGEFHAHPLVEESRTIGLPATGDGCLAVASHVARNTWDSDQGEQHDWRLVVGRNSPFSGMGPTRDGRQKPDVSAPGQYITAALAADSASVTEDTARTLVRQRLLTIEGTSMAAPMIAGIVALMLQKKPSLTLEEARRVLAQAARHDGHTGPGDWNPTYGFGKVDVAAALRLVS